MKSILIVQSVFRLKRLLRRKDPAALRKGYYLLLSPALRGAISLLKFFGFKPLQGGSYTREQRETILHDYVEAMGRMAELNGHDLQWWATDIASKNRFASPMPELLNGLVRCLGAIEEMADDGQLLVLLGPPWPVVRSLEKEAELLDWDLRVISWPWSRLSARLFGQAKSWGSLAKELLISIFHILEARNHFGQISPRKQNERPVYLIKSFVYPNAFSEEGLYKDPFFGKFPEFLSHRLGDAANLLTVALGFEKRAYCYRRMRGLTGGQVVPLEAYLKCPDAIKGFIAIAWGRLANKFRVPGKVPFLGHDISELLRETLASGGWKISLAQYLHFAAGVSIARTYNIIACTMTYEGNPWERMFIKGLQNVQPDLFIAGYQHAVIPQSAAGMFSSQREEGCIPFPSFVLTTGPIPASIVERYGALSDGRIRVACALRFGYLYSLDSLPRQNFPDSFRVLVVLEGVRDVLPLVKYVLDHAPTCRKMKFRIRAHPVLPFDRLLSHLGRNAKINDNVEVSHGRSILEDLEECDVVLYWGTTVALEALMLGKPVVHFDRGDTLSYDPLFELEDFKWTVDAVADLNAILNEIRTLPDQEYYVLQERARQYVMEYFLRPQDNSMSQFLPMEV
jgi:hypothetical protein